MQKILFNEKYGLTQAVLDGRKTMTRRIASPSNDRQISLANLNKEWYEDDEGNTYISKYEVGEVVAIAQSYKNIADSGYSVDSRYDSFRTEKWDENKRAYGRLKTHHGWNNKMFVKADLMPHHIRITNVKAERLQDISEEDCLKEGIVDYGLEYDDYGDPQYGYKGSQMFINPIDAFRSLIDKVSGKGTFSYNPHVWVYEFELID
jgi:hypothetical protein